MTPITTISPISTSTVRSVSISATSEASAAEGAKTFSSLLESLGNTAQQGENSDTTLPEELLEKVEDMLTLLQEQPVEELTAAQQKIMYELMQMIRSQLEKKESPLLVNTDGGSKVRPVLPESENQELSKEVKVKLFELVKKLSDLMPAASTSDIKKFELTSAIMGVEGKTIALDVEKTVAITNKITEFIETLTNIEKKAATEVHTAAAKLVVISAEEQLKLLGEVKNIDVDEPETLKAHSSAPVIAAGRNEGGKQEETAQQDDTKQGLTQTTVSAESGKPATVPAQVTQQVQAKPEPPLSPAPMVRMNNLVEELGEVFKNSLRISTSGESTQIKVNISPDHLGHLDIRLTETNGRIAAQIFTSSLAAKEALDLQLSQLRSTLVQQGMTVEKIEVVQNNSQQSLGQQNAQSEQRFSQQQRQNPAGRERNGYQQIDEKTAVERSYLDSETMKVDYTV